VLNEAYAKKEPYLSTAKSTIILCQKYLNLYITNIFFKEAKIIDSKGGMRWPKKG
jgi:hypothetical protein